MQLLEEKIKTDGIAVNEDILKVDSFINHKVDPFLMKEIGKDFAAHFADQGITKIVTIESSGIAPALTTAIEMGIPMVDHRAVQMKKEDYRNYNYLIGMDQWNIRNMMRIVGKDPDHKIFKMLEFAGSDRDVADPWYTGDFDATYCDIVAGCTGLLEKIREEKGF